MRISQRESVAQVFCEPPIGDLNIIKGEITMNEVRENKFLKIMSIIMLIGGILGAVLSLIPAAVGIIGALIGLSLGDMAMLIISTVLLVIGVILQIIAGVKGMKAATNEALAPACVKLGILCILVSLASNVLGAMTPDGSFSITSLITACIIPGLYTYSAMKK